ncbi:hypothetical protein [Peribacillus huizhouensis]|uniref:Uncharacterized protein n=1 Tax=Peribacillus huizhouensis TaxID=1501239 RepID=A0ABR6CSB4_9BACI|nr:hypothetical protein [Peribacillus huizhouensis]MBA9027914.1 hypothetical protein [Peribacillus huizhouensis]
MLESLVLAAKDCDGFSYLLEKSIDQSSRIASGISILAYKHV